MDCIQQNSIVITLSIVTHGAIESTLLTEEQQSLLSDTRLFTLAGGFEDVVCMDMLRNNYSNYLSTLFRQDLEQGSYKVMKDYRKKAKKSYTDFSSFFDTLTNSNVCSIYQHITIDKIFGLEEKPNSQLGIFVVSVHEKQGDTLKLIYPENKNKGDTERINLMLLDDFQRFASLFNHKIPSNIFDNLGEDVISVNEKMGYIEYIRMSYLIYIIRNIVANRSDIEEGGKNCKINLFDFSCISLGRHLSINKPSVKMNLNYMKTEDEEQGIPKWGGNFGRKK